MINLEILSGFSCPLVNEYGQFIPAGLSAPVVAPNPEYFLARPADDYEDRFNRMAGAFNCASKITALDFIERTSKVIEAVRSNDRLANLLSGVYLRLLLPQITIDSHSRVLEEIFLPAAKAAYEKEFPGRKFVNLQENQLINEVSLVPGIRYEKLISAMEKGPVPAVYFPLAFLAYSILAVREIIPILPGIIIPSGVYDLSAAIAGYADIMARDLKTPAFDAPAFQWRSDKCSLHLNATDNQLRFGARLLSGHSTYSSGALILG
jgi:hypothetical protein